VTRRVSVAEVRSRLGGRSEIALLDVREEAPYAEAHPLFAASLPLSRLELEVFDRLPRRSVPIVVYDNGEGLAQRAVKRLGDIGYSSIEVLDGGLTAWRAAGAELFSDVNVPSKAFGELVEARRHTPSISAEELNSKLRAREDLVVLDARRFEEYQTMSIPSATSVPGGELALRVRDIAPNPQTLVVVNCAGRTRSILGAQSLLNADTPNPVAALRNGTIGWTLAGLSLDRGKSNRYSSAPSPTRAQAAQAARSLAARAGVARVDLEQLDVWSVDPARTLYRFDVRTPEEYRAGHLPHFQSAPGGQLVQETDAFAPVRGARVVLADDDGVRANMTASWLAQMGWDASVLSIQVDGDRLELGSFRPSTPLLPVVARIDALPLAVLLNQTDATIIDLGRSTEYQSGHLPGAWFALRSELATNLSAVSPKLPIVLTSRDGVLATFAAPEVESLTRIRPLVLTGGTAAWKAAGQRMETGPTRFLASPIDVYKRPYEGTDNPREAMQAYLDWEFGLVAQLERDGTHNFYVI
jgi:rhodanese-related sulfurtransferase